MSSERLFKALECEKIQCSFAVVGEISLNSEVNDVQHGHRNVFVSFVSLFIN